MLMADYDIRSLIGKPLRSRAMVAYALCAIAEEELRAGTPARALETIKAVREITAGMSMQLSGDTSAMSVAEIREAKELLTGVDARLEAIAALVSPHTIH
jgi:hypothetical protein